MTRTDSMLSRHEAASVSPRDARTKSLAREFLTLSKPGITRLVTVASAAGFGLASFRSGGGGEGLAIAAAGCVLGTAAASAGANALNQVIEVERDAIMARTASRPLPSGRLTRPQGLAFALACSVAGPLLLALTTNWVAASLAALTVVLYVAVYTPLKLVSPISTFVGAIPGALPCVIGWTAGSAEPLAELGRLPAWSFFVVLLTWQIPHFLAIAMMYREQYTSAGFVPISPNASSKRVALQIVAWTGLTVLASAVPLAVMPESIGVLYASVAALSGAFFLSQAVSMLQSPTKAAARAVFFASIGYLPIVFIALVIDAFAWNPEL
ncbi:MAG: heme o synthase [Planctomycetota bacterium]